MSRTIQVSLRWTWIGGAALLGVLGGLSFASIAMGAWNAGLQREAGSLRTEIDSLVHDRQGLDRQALLLVAIERVVPDVDDATTALVAREIDRNATLYGFDPLVILAVVVTESGIQVSAQGRYVSGNASGAQGVMQIKPATARAMARALGMDEPDDSQLHDPSYNLAVGVAYLLQMVHRFQDLRLGIMAYNVGPTALMNILRDDRARPEAYYRKVWLTYRKLSQGLARR